MSTHTRKRSHESSDSTGCGVPLSPGFVLYKPSQHLHLLVCSSDVLPLPAPFCIVFFTHQSECSFVGKFSLTHLFGPPVHILGASLKADRSTTWVMFSPNSHSLLSISQLAINFPLLQPVTRELLSSIFTDIIPSNFLEFVTSTVFECTSEWDSAPSILILRPFKCRITDSITCVKKFRALFYSFGGIFSVEETASLGFDAFYNDPLRGFRISSQMEDLAESFKSRVFSMAKFDKASPTVLIAGPKSAGKSSLVRFLINNYLTAHDPVNPSIAVLDCDIGQPEFTTCGMVSLTVVKRPLFGPPFSHQILADPKPIRQCFVGSITPSDDPNFYLDCLNYVYDAYRQLEAPRPPLIVNTMGWTQGLGLSLIVEQILMTRPNIVAQIDLHSHQPGARQNLPILNASTLRTMQGWYSQDLSEKHFSHEVIIIPSMSSSSKHHSPNPASQFGAPDHRDLTLLAYFANTLANAPTSLPGRGPNGDLGHPVAHFLDCLPYRIPLMSSSDDCTSKDEEDCNRLSICVMQPKSTLFPRSAVSPLRLTVDTVLSLLNATLVALCAVPAEQIEKSDEPRSCSLISSNPVCECFGLGICRAIDPSAGILYLTTGVQTSDLVKVTGILRGSVNLPQCFFLEQPIPEPTSVNPEPIFIPYLGPQETQGPGRTGLPSRRSYPRTMHHEFHRTGSSEGFEPTP